MKRKINFFLRYLLIALLSCGITVCGAVLYSRRDLDVMHFGIWFSLGAAILLVLCLLLSRFLPRERGDELQESIRHLNDILTQQQERFAFYPNRDTPSVELSDLCQNIRRLCNKILLSRYRLQAEEEQFDFILSTMNEGFLMVDFEKRILCYNRIAQHVLKLHGDIDHQLLSSVTEDADVLKAVDKAIQTNKVTNYDITTPDGSVYALQSRLVRSEGYRSKGGVMIVLFDVTSERNALKQRQDYFSNASHELRTPITSIMGFSEMLEGGMITDPDQAKDFIRIIHREATRMSQIINDLLFISKLENEGEPTVSSPVNVREIAEEIRDSLLPSMQEKNIKMSISGGDFNISLPYTHLHNLLSNLMQNAVKYNVENGSVWVRIETDDRHLYLSVKDTGIGIPPDMRSRVFERFFRVDKGRSRNVGGTGLGLSIVKHLVNLYNGSIQLDSELGKGSLFHVSLTYPPEVAPESDKKKS